jgi:hypothetical protein
MQNKVLLVISTSNLKLLEEMKEIITDDRVLVRVVSDEAWELMMKDKDLPS